MSFSKTVIRNSGLLAASHLITKILQLVLLLILTRALGVEDFGRYSVGLAYAMLFMPFALMGFSGLIIREMSQKPEDAEEIYQKILPAVVLFALTAAAACYFSSLLYFENPLDTQVVGVLALYMMFDSWSRLVFSVFRGHQKMQYEAIVNVAERILLFVITVAGWWWQWTLLPFMWGFTAAQLFKAVLGQYYVWKYFFGPRFRVDWPYLRYFTREAFPFLLTATLGTLSLRVDVLMLKAFHGDESVGIYNAGRRIVESLSFVSENLYSALFPAFSAIAVTKIERFRGIFQQANKAMLVLAIPLLAWLFILAPEITAFLFEPEFADTAVAIRWLSIFLAILFIKRLYLAAHNALGWQRLVAVTFAITLALNIGLNYLLIPDYLYLGASIATIISEGFTLIVLVVVLWKRTRAPSLDGGFMRAVLCGILLFVAVYFCRSLPLLVIPPLTAILYLLLLRLLQVFSDAERQQFKSMMPAKIGKFL